MDATCDMALVEAEAAEEYWGVHNNKASFLRSTQAHDCDVDHTVEWRRCDEDWIHSFRMFWKEGVLELLSAAPGSLLLSGGFSPES